MRIRSIIESHRRYLTISHIACRDFSAKLGLLSHASTHSHPSGDAQLWLTAFALSGVLNLLLLILAGIGFIKWQTVKVDLVPPTAPAEVSATIYIEAPPAEKVSMMLEDSKRRFTRTSDEQETEKRDERSDFIGERNTTATSDQAPDDSAELLPSQKGVEREDEREIETTESDYQDGEVTDSSSSPAAASDLIEVQDTAEPSTQESVGEVDVADPGQDEEKSLPPAREELLDGPNPVDVQVPKEQGVEEEIKETVKKPKVEEALPKETIIDTSVTPKNPNPKAFSGFQRKTAIVGSISRTGKSALNVDDTVMGRYQAAISKAVEQEWQRNCVRHRDFITPGFLTVRFFVAPNGKVKTVQFVGEMETSEIQKGFTLNSIRDAEIPEMPKDMKPAYEGDSLELIFRFYF